MRARSGLLRADFEGQFRCLGAERARVSVKAREASAEDGRLVEAVEWRKRVARNHLPLEQLEQHSDQPAFPAEAQDLHAQILK
jgi:hypothetical protein